MFTEFDTAAFTERPATGYGPCRWCGQRSTFRAADGDFCSDDHASLHRVSEYTHRRAGAR